MGKEKRRGRAPKKDLGWLDGKAITTEQQTGEHKASDDIKGLLDLCAELAKDRSGKQGRAKHHD